MTSSEEILLAVSPATSIVGFDHINELVNDPNCLTLIERPFFDQIRPIVRKICSNGIRGDVVIVGVFKGGGALYLKALFEELGVFNRWWLIDSFKGFNRKTLTHCKDISALDTFNKRIKVKNQPSRQSVEKLFHDYGLGNNLTVVDGFIEETLHQLPIKEISLLHIDVDFYEPTYLCLDSLYPKVKPGGWTIIDDYNVEVFNCKEAVDAFRTNFKIDTPLLEIGNYPVGWQR